MGNILKSVFKKIVREDSFLYQWVYSRYKFGLFAPGITKDPGTIITRYNNLKKEDLFFVQIGANDGKSGDPLYEFIINNNWKGILIEPMPDVFEQLKENFSFASGRLIFENSAISDTGGEFTIYYIDNSGKKFPEWVSQLTSFNKDVLQKEFDLLPGICPAYKREKNSVAQFFSIA